MDRTRIGRAFLALCGPRWEETASLSQDDWTGLAAMAEQHRLAPFLHGRLMRGEIAGMPPVIARTWQDAHRRNAITALSQRSALLRAVEQLATATIGTVALKGAALAWTVWPGPAERAMRDIDILVPAEDAARAYEVLRAAGWEAPELLPADRDAFAREEIHFPPLHSREGVMCELHARLWAETQGTTMPLSCEDHMLANARYEERLGAAVPAAEDMLVHLVVHAAFSHGLNTGPMTLIDIDLLCMRKRIDWPAFWERADAAGFARAAALLFALVDRWRRPGFLQETDCPIAVESGALDEMELLLVQDLDERKDVGALAALSAGRISGRFDQHPLDRAEGKASLAGRVGQLAARARSLAGSALSRDTRHAAMATGRLRKWIEG